MLRALAVAGLMLSACHAFGQSSGQSTTPRSEFEVASMKPNKSGDGRMAFGAKGGRFTVTNMPLLILIMQSYSIKNFQLSGAPDWLMSERYDIEAKAEGNPSMIEMLPMIQALLEDRMRLKFHRESKEMPIYALVVAKAGRLHESPDECGPRPASPPPPPARDQLPPVRCGSVMMSFGHLKGAKITITQLIDPLSRSVNRVVLDQTNLTGKYDIDLEFALERRPPSVLAGPSDGLQLPADDPTGPSLFTALQEQLGLKLESQKGPVEIMVVDHVERPTEN